MNEHQDGAASIGTLLTELAEREPVPPIAYDAVLSRGRRRRARRRIAVSAGAALAVTAVTAGVLVALPEPGSGGRPASGGSLPVVVPSSAAATTGSPSAAPTADAPAVPPTRATTPSAHDPLEPGPRVRVASGTDSMGHHWQVFARMWYAAGTHENAYRQNIAVWQYEGSVPNRKPTRRYTDMLPVAVDHVQTELWLDGVHTNTQGDFFDADSPGFGLSHLTSVPAFQRNQVPVDAMTNQTCMGWSKSGSTPMVVGTGAVRPDIVKVTVHWPDGSVEHPALIPVDRSPDHYFAYTCHTGVGTASGYDKHGTELLRSPIQGK